MARSDKLLKEFYRNMSVQDMITGLTTKDQPTTKIEQNSLELYFLVSSSPMFNLRMYVNLISNVGALAAVP